MMRAMSLAAVAAVLALAGPSGAWAQPAPARPAPPPPVVRVEGLKAVSAHVQVIPDNSAPLVPNVGFIVGRKGVLVVDTGLGPANGAAVLAVAGRVAPGRAIWLVATHAHPEHDLGAQAFPASAKMIRSADQTADIPNDMALAKVFAGFSPEIAAMLADARPRAADVGFEREYELDLGGVSARLIALGPNHTAGDTAIWVAADRVLFSGDVAMKAQPALVTPKTTIPQWLGSLDRLEALKPTVVVPSHGPVGDAGFIRGYRTYLAEVAERTAAAKAAGQDLAAATAAVTAAMGARYPDKGRLAGAVKVAFGDGK
jgi:glyoxylase-like metal-dependent hydrolase (beta-lactamase superfamily II)